MGRWADWRHKVGARVYGRDSLAQEGQELVASVLLANPSLQDAISGRNFSGGGVQPLDQTFDKYLEAVGLFPWVTACIDAIAKAAASVPVKLMRGPEGEAEEVTDHPLLDLIRDPNPDQGTFEFLYSCHQHFGFTGESMVTAVGTPEETPFANPEEFWVVQPDKLAPVFDKTRRRRGRGDSPLLGWTFTETAGKSIKYPAESIVLAKMPHPGDPVRGLSPLKRLECALNLLWSVLQANKAYLANGAGPGLVIRMGVPPDSPLAQRFEKKMDASHAGSANRGKNLYLYGQNIEILKDRVMDSAEDAQYLELLKIVREWILAEFKVPPFAIGLLEHANWSNSVEQQQYFYQNAVIPQNKLLFDSWNSSPLVQVWGEELWLDPDYSEIAALQPNKSEQAAADVQLVAQGIQTINEIRAARGYGEPVPWGDKPIPSPLAYAYGVNPFEYERDPALTPSTPTGAAAEDDALTRRDAAWILIRQAKELRAAGRPRDARSARWRAFALRSEPIERRWERLWRGLFKDLRAEVLEELNRNLSSALAARDTALQLENGGDVELQDDRPLPMGFGDLFDPAAIAEAWRQAIAELAARTFQRGAEDTLEEIGDETIPFPIDDPRIVDYLEREVARRIRTIADNRLSEVTDLVRAAVTEGVSVEELQTRLREHFDRNTPFWSRRIARTETAGLYNRGALAGMEDAGIETKEWLSSRDTDVRPSHVSIDGTNVRLGEDFVFPSGARGPFPGQIDSAEENIGCRCTTVPGEAG